MFNILFIADAVSLPSGMAATQRLLALARGVQSAGAEVRIKLLRPTELDEKSVNHESSGVIFGIPFEYVCGTPYMARNRFARRWQELRGCFNGIRCIWNWKCVCQPSQRQFCVITYSRHLSTIIPVAIFCKLWRIPLIAEMCEWPVTQAMTMRLGRLRKKLFCDWVVRFIDGALPISRYIDEQLHAQAKRHKQALPTLRVPILVDTCEYLTNVTTTPPCSVPLLDTPSFERNNEDSVVLTKSSPSIKVFRSPYILFGGSAAYRKTIEFILDVFQLTRGTFTSDVQLVMTGIDVQKNLWLVESVKRRGLIDQVIFPGFIARPELLNAYRHAHALLIPLFDDLQSKARFPTKLAEYLLSGTPVVTNPVGDVPLYLHHQKDVYLVPPDDEQAFANMLAYVIQNQAEARKVGGHGYEVARTNFNHVEHGRSILEWLGVHYTRIITL